MNLSNDWLLGGVNKIIPKRNLESGGKMYRELISVQLYSHKLAVMEHLLRVVLVPMSICTRQIQNIPVTWGALSILYCWAHLLRSENKATPKGQW